jgi:hypothetical protein
VELRSKFAPPVIGGGGGGGGVGGLEGVDEAEEPDWTPLPLEDTLDTGAEEANEETADELVGKLADGPADTAAM